MKNNFPVYILLLCLFCNSIISNAQIPENYPANYASAPRFKALVFYTEHAEEAHVDFSRQAVAFFKKLNYGDGFYLDITQDLANYPFVAPPEWGYSLPVVYLVWLLVVIVMYALCRWFAALKQRRNDWWLSYL